MIADALAASAAAVHGSQDERGERGGSEDQGGDQQGGQDQGPLGECPQAEPGQMGTGPAEYPGGGRGAVGGLQRRGGQHGVTAPPTTTNPDHAS